MSFQGTFLKFGMEVLDEYLNLFGFIHIKTKYGYTYPIVAPDADTSAKTASGNIASSDFGKTVTNEGASAAITLTLPAASSYKGKVIRVKAVAAQAINVDVQSGDAIYFGGDGVDGKYLTIAGSAGNYADIYCDGTNYLVVGGVGLSKEA